MTNLTSKDFWDSYWKEFDLPCEVDFTRPFERCLGQKLDFFLKRYSADGVNASIFEIGCAPGKWLSYLSKKHSLNPNGLEYLDKAYDTTVRNLKSLNLPSSGIIKGDFFKIKPRPVHDVVISLGFVEHFVDVDHVVERHLCWLKPGGIMILGVPNFNNVNQVIQNILNKNILVAHNTDIMNKKYFHHIARKFNLYPEFIGYLGSFDPAIFIGEQNKANKLQFITNISLQVLKRIRNIRVFDYLNNAMFSSYILSVYRIAD